MSATVGTVILEQLGGRRFVAMTGARNLVALDAGIMFNVGAGALRGINKVRIVLDPSDTYTIEFWRIARSATRGRVPQLVETYSDVYCDALVPVFERVTGFVTRL